MKDNYQALMQTHTPGLILEQPVGDAVGSIGTGVENGVDRIGKGAEDIGHGKNPGRNF